MMKRIVILMLSLVIVVTMSACGSKEEESSVQRSVPQNPAEALISLVGDAAKLVEEKGEDAFADFALEGTRWNQGDNYIFVVDLNGTFVVHPDPALAGKNQMALRDVNGKPIVEWFISEVTGQDNNGWSHYLWEKPGEIFPSWKTTYLQRVATPAGKEYIVASGAYNLKTEKVFIVDGVNDAVKLMKQQGTEAFSIFRDKASEFIYKDVYVFVLDDKGTLLVDPPFPTLEGQNLYDYQDSNGKYVFREFIEVATSRGSGWVNYLWPEPGEDEPAQKTSFVQSVEVGEDVYIVGTGMYVNDYEERHHFVDTESPHNELVSLVEEAAKLVEEKGENAFNDFAVEGTKWNQSETYIFVVDLDGTFVVHPDPSLAGRNQTHLTDVNGKPIVEWFISEVTGKDSNGWSHYLWVKPGEIFPSWKTTYLQLATTPSGKQYIVASGAYDLGTQKAFVTDGVNDAVELIKKEGAAAFSVLRDKASEFIYKDTYVFVLDDKGTLLVNPPFPSIEGRNLYDYKDAGNKYLFREFIEVATTQGSGWVDYIWPHPGEDEPHEKTSFVRKVEVGTDVYIVGAGMYHAKPDSDGNDPSTVPAQSDEDPTLTPPANTIWTP